MNSELSNKIKAEAQSLGFYACGIAKADAVDNETATRYKEWIAQGKNGEMAYLNNYTDKRLDPRLLMTGLKSIVCVALNYAPAERMPDDEYQLAAYAYGQDYHDIVKNKLRQLAARFGFECLDVKGSHADDGNVHYRAFCDSAPVLERYWAVQAGIGWKGKSQQLIIPQAGTMFVLGELFLDIELEYDQPMKNRCGRCHRCIDACPTQALKEGEGMDARRCLSYLTIENRGDITPEVAAKMGNTIYGCDRCQLACPWNHFAQPNHTPELQPRPELMNMTKEKWQNLTEEEYRALFRGSAVKRAKYSGLMRNIHAVEKKE